MARLLIDGFESGGYDIYSASANTSVISSAGKDMDGSYCLDLTAGGAYVYKAVSAISEVYASVLWRPSAPSNSQPIFRLQNGVLFVTELYRNNSTNKLNIASSVGTKTISNDTTYLIELYYKIAASGGRIVVKVDGVTDIDFTGNTGTGLFNRFYLGRDSATYIAKAYFDNFKLDDADYPGDNNIQAIVPTGVGNTTEWTPSAGANWECVDEIPKNDADYVSTTGTKKDTYVTGDLAGSIGSIKCVQIQSRSRSISFTNDLILIIRSGGTDYESDTYVVGGTFNTYHYIWETDPADSAAWEEADVNAIEIGVKNNTGNNLGSYQVLAQVEWAGIDETLRSLTIVSIVSESDGLNQNEHDRSIVILSTVSVIDIQTYVDTKLSILISIAVSVTDFQAYSDKLLLVVILVTTSVVEFEGFDELGRLISLNLGISDTDVQAYKDLQTLISLSLTPSISDVQTYIDTGLAISSTLAVSVFDSIPYNDTDLLVNIVSGISAVDNQGYSEILNIPLLLEVTKTDIQVYVDDMLILMGMSVELSDTVYEQMLIEMTMSLIAIDGYATDTTRQVYELISREKSFELIGRTKTYYLEKG